MIDIQLFDESNHIFIFTCLGSTTSQNQMKQEKDESKLVRLISSTNQGNGVPSAFV